MAKKRIDQLELLNTKFDKLIEVLLGQKAQPQTTETVKSVEDVDVILKHEAKPVPKILVQKPKVVSFFVDPNAMITINGVPYEGNISVDEGLATIIRRMLCDWQRYNTRVFQDTAHSAKDNVPLLQRTISGKI